MCRNSKTANKTVGVLSLSTSLIIMPVYYCLCCAHIMHFLYFFLFAVYNVCLFIRAVEMGFKNLGFFSFFTKKTKNFKSPNCKGFLKFF